jgi:hypothetical protein
MFLSWHGPDDTHTEPGATLNVVNSNVPVRT